MKWRCGTSTPRRSLPQVSGMPKMHCKNELFPLHLLSFQPIRTDWSRSWGMQTIKNSVLQTRYRRCVTNNARGRRHLCGGSKKRRADGSRQRTKSDISSLLSLHDSSMVVHASQCNESDRFVTLPGPSAAEPGAVDFWEVRGGASEEVIWSILFRVRRGETREKPHSNLARETRWSRVILRYPTLVIITSLRDGDVACIDGQFATLGAIFS